MNHWGFTEIRIMLNHLNGNWSRVQNNNKLWNLRGTKHATYIFEVYNINNEIFSTASHVKYTPQHVKH